MYLLKLSLIFFFCVLSFTMLPSSLAQDSPQEYVNAHNAARAQVGVGPIQWDERLANNARQSANQRAKTCRLVHNNGGENLALIDGLGSPDTTVVRLWVDEKQYYNYGSNTCAARQVCAHYTQVVWRNSARIGCANVKCANKQGTFVICYYEPTGNINGQKPY